MLSKTFPYKLRMTFHVKKSLFKEKNMKSTCFWVLELDIPVISLILKNVHIENAVIIPENFHKIFQVPNYLFM